MFGMVKTDDKELRIQLGKKFDRAFYDDKEKRKVMDVVERFEEKSSVEKKMENYYLSIYDYWAFGVSTVEYYYYKFTEKSMSEKEKYLTFRNRTDYYFHMNDKGEAYLFNNKWETYQRFRDYYKRDAIVISDDEDFPLFEEFVRKHEEFVVKPISLGLAIGVFKEKVNDHDDLRTLFQQLILHGKTIKGQNEWKNWDSNPSIMLEEIIAQTEELGLIHPVSINAIRITTIRKGDDVTIFYPWWLVGQAGDFVVGGAVGSILAGINPMTGIVETDGIDESLNVYEAHPDTGIKFKGFAIPHWEEAVEMAKTLALGLDKVNHVGWDFAYTKDGWVIMEANFDGEFCGQLIYQKPIKEELESIIDWKCTKDFWWKNS